MAEADLGPSELDLLEDALEELELDGALERLAADEVEPRVLARLADYRSVLAAAREALPLEDVPAGVLDGVLAQAQQAAAVPAVAAAGAASEPWWTRLRRSFMVPVLALAGTAALVLWVFDPKDQLLLDAPAGPPAPAPERAAAADKAPAAAARLEEGGEQAEATPAAPTVAPTPAVDAKSADLDDQGMLPAAEAKPDAHEKNEEPAKPAEGYGGGMTSLGDVPGSVPGGVGGGMPSQPQAQTKSGGSAGPASGRWDIVSRGDRARQAGDCVAAREEYALALEDDEARVRARALAGLGLCDAAAGDEASADASFEKARALDDEIGAFIESQSERTRGAGKKSRKPTKKSKVQAADAFDDASDPAQ